MVSYQAERYWVRDEQLAAWAVEDGDDDLLWARGPCPSCGHPTMAEIASTVLAGAAGVEAPPAPRTDREWITRVVECACNVAHYESATDSGTSPTQRNSCGRWWLASVRRQATEGQRVRAAVDDTLLMAAKAVQNDVATEESRLREAAEKWTTAITSLFGLFGLSGLIFGKDALTGLPTWARVVAGLLALTAIALGARAFLAVYRSAYGWPVLTDLGNDEILRTWYAAKRKRLGGAAEEIRKGVQLSLAALAALAVVAALIWFGPRTPARPMLTVTLTTDTQVCGELLDSAGDLPLRIREINGEVVPLRANEIKTVKATAACRG